MSTSVFTLYAFAVASLLFAFYRPIINLLTPRGIKGFPTLPSPVPIFGDALVVGKGFRAHGGLGGCMKELIKQLGPNFQLRIFFNHYLWLNDYSTAIAVSQDRSGTFDTIQLVSDYLRQIVPTGMITLHTDEVWKHHRRIMGPAMTSRYLSKSTGKMNDSVRDLVSLWTRKADLAHGKAFSASHDMENAAMDTICDMAFGTSWGCTRYADEQIGSRRVASIGELDEAIFHVDRPDLAKAVWYLLDSIGHDKTLFIKYVHFFIRLTPTYRMHRTRLDNELRRAIHESRRQAEQSQEAENTVDLMVGKGGSKRDELAENEMRDELLTCPQTSSSVLENGLTLIDVDLLGGTETTAMTFCWWLKAFTNHPETQAKLRDHIRQAIPDKQLGEFSMEDLTSEKTPYLEAVVYEALRYGQLSIAFGRLVMKDTVLLGQHVPKGTRLIFPNNIGMEEAPGWHAGRADEVERKVGLWQPGSAEEYRPERWLREDGSFDPNAGPMTPFGSGIRGCFGKNLALLELRMFIAQLNMTFFFAPVSEAQNSLESFDSITRHPKMTLIKPVSWDSAEAKAAMLAKSVG